MKGVVVEEGISREPPREEGPREGVRDGAALLHDVPELTGGGERTPFLVRAVLVDRRALDVQRASAHGCPRESGDDSGRGLFVDAIRLERGLAHVLDQVLARVHDDRIGHRGGLDHLDHRSLRGGQGLLRVLHLLLRRLHRLLALGAGICLLEFVLLRLECLLRGSHLVPRLAHFLGRLRALRLGQLERHLAVDLLEVLLEVPDPSLPAVVLDERVHRRVGDASLLFPYAASLLRRLLEVGPGDGALLVGDVPAQSHHLHAIEEGTRDGVQDVGGAHEENLAEVHGHVQVVVEERSVLLRIEELEQRGRRITLEPAPELVDFVDQNHRVGNARALEALHQLTGHGAHVRAPVPFDLRDVAQTSDGEAEEFSIQRARDALPDGGLTDARGSHHGDDLALRRSAQLAHRDKLQDSLLDILQAVVVGIEDIRRLRDIQPFLGRVAPRDGREPLEVVPGDVKLRRRRLQSGEFVQLLVDCLHGVRGRSVLERRELLPELLLQRRLIVSLHAELLLDGLELFHEEVSALVAGDLLLDTPADVRLQLTQLNLLFQEHERGLEALADVESVQNLLKRAVVRAAHRRGEVGELGGVLEILESLRKVLKRLFRERVHLEKVFDRGDDLVRRGLEDVVVVPVRHLRILDVVHLHHHGLVSHRRRLAKPAVPEQQQRRAAAAILALCRPDPSLRLGLDVHLVVPNRRSLVVLVLERVRGDVGDSNHGLNLRERAYVVHVVARVHVFALALGSLEEGAHVRLPTRLHLLDLLDEPLVHHTYGHDHPGHQRASVQRDDEHLRVARRVPARDHDPTAARRRRGSSLARGVGAAVEGTRTALPGSCAHGIPHSGRPRVVAV